MGNAEVCYCQSCGAALNPEMNMSFIFCQYCGAKNIIASERMSTNIDVGGLHIKANTEIEHIIASAEFAVSVGQYDKATELLVAAVISGSQDYRIYILMAKIDLQLDNNRCLFENLRKLQEFEYNQSPEQEVTKAICELMQYRGKNGVTALHNATFHECMEMTVFCVQHGSDVNCIAGMNRVTPISIMYVPLSANTSRIDGTPFIRNIAAVEEIRRYLMFYGAY